MSEESAEKGARFENGLNEDIPGTCERKLTEKGREEKVRRLKNNQTARLAAVSKQRNALTGLMESENNLHLVYSELDVLNTLFREYQEAYNLHYRELTSEEDLDKELDHYESKEKSLLEFRKQVIEWISVAEHRLAGELELLSDGKSGSYKSSTRSRKSTCTTSSTRSARAKEKLRLAELQAEREMLNRKQALQAADEALRLETEIAKAQARERVYASLEDDQGNLENKDADIPVVELSQPKLMSSLEEFQDGDEGEKDRQA